MDPFRIVRVVGFFVAGVVVAVGGALIYSTAQRPLRPFEISQSPADAHQPVSTPMSPLVINPADPSTLSEAPARRANTAAPRAQSSALAPKAAVAPIAKPPVPVLRLPRTDASYESGPDSAPILLVPARAASASDPSANSISPRADFASIESTRQAPSGTSIARSIPPATQPREVHRIASPLAGRQAHVITLERGLVLSVRLSDKLSTDYNFSGETFHSLLEEPVIANGFIIADKGSTVFGRIEYARKAHLLVGDSELTLALTAISTTDRQIVGIETSPWRQKGARTSVVNTAEMAVGAAAGAVVGALSGAARGAGLSSAIDENSAAAKIKIAKPRSITLLPGTELSFRLAMPVTVHERLNSR